MLPSDLNNIETYWFVCRRWFDKGEDDGQIKRELLPTDEDGKALEGGLEGKILHSKTIVSMGKACLRGNSTYDVLTSSK